MEFAIIAAGEGSRLREEGYKFSKPMVVLRETTLISRLVKIFLKNGATKIHIIINESSPDLRLHLNDMDIKELNIIVKSTHSSLHSFNEIVPFVTSDKICLTTVDTVFNELEFEAYVNEFKGDNSIEGLMAVTSFVDDESPLYVHTDGDLNITGFYDRNGKGSHFVSGGIYCLTERIYPIVKKAVETGACRMRNFQRLMITEGVHLKAYPFSKIIDIDHVSDIKKAEDFLCEAAVVN